MIGLSKSKYTTYCQCGKALWLKEYNPDEAKVDDATNARFDSGNEVGDLAMGLLGTYKEVTTPRADGSLDLGAMIEKTKQYMNEGVENIAEASFFSPGNYCAVDILHKTPDGWAIYEVKSSTWSPDAEKEKDPPVPKCRKWDLNKYKDFVAKKFQKYATDIAYQKWVLTQCGVNVTGTFLVLLDSAYVLRGEKPKVGYTEIDLQAIAAHGRDGHNDPAKLFAVIDLADVVAQEYEKVPDRVKAASALINQSKEPDIDLGKHCRKPYPCAFWQYCMGQKKLPTPSVFDLYGTLFDKKIKLYEAGKVGFGDLQQGVVPNKNLQIQIGCTLNHSEHIDKNAIHKFLDTLSYPLYFLDFETMPPVIPEFDGTRPYQQIPFQYSLHYIEHVGGKLKHKEFLAKSGTDTRRAVAEQLCKDIPKDVCVLAYNDRFEKERIEELAEAFHDLAPHLLNIHDHIKDLLVPFKAWAYYTPAMGGSFSIKSVLPALFPGDPELDYHNLEGVHNGGEAMTIFPKIKDMSPEKQAEASRNLLKYCKLDTLAMVKVWQKLIEVSKYEIISKNNWI